MDEIMLKIYNVSKKYRLGQIGGTTLRDELQRFSARIRHKEDPTKKIGAKDYNKGETFLALDGISFEVKKGERVGIIGHNGAGKSTLLKLISRVTAPTGGIISMNGRVASMLEVGTGFHPELTGRENIYMNGAILGMTKKEIDAKMEDIIEFSECRQFIDTPVKRYSSGMYVKLAFSVAAHLDSEIMIMDEVLAVGDMNFQQKCLKKMKNVSDIEGRTVLYVSHNMSTIRQLCDRCIVLDHGKIKYDGDVDNAINIYLNAYDDSESQLDIDLSNIVHITENHNATVFMKRIELIDKEQPIYCSGEALKFRLTFDAKSEINGLSLRVSLNDSSLVPIATSYSDYLYYNYGDHQTIEVELSLDSIKESDYYVSIGFFSINTLSLPYCNDFISRAFKISVVRDVDYKYSFEWNCRHYGYIELKPVSINYLD